MARIDAILKLVKEQGASDLHMTTGAPPIIRIHGEITPIPYDLKKLVEISLSKHRVARGSELREALRKVA